MVVIISFGCKSISEMLRLISKDFVFILFDCQLFHCLVSGHFRLGMSRFGLLGP